MHTLKDFVQFFSMRRWYSATQYPTLKLVYTTQKANCQFHKGTVYKSVPWQKEAFCFIFPRAATSLSLEAQNQASLIICFLEHIILKTPSAHKGRAVLTKCTVVLSGFLFFYFVNVNLIRSRVYRELIWLVKHIFLVLLN